MKIGGASTTHQTALLLHKLSIIFLPIVRIFFRFSFIFLSFPSFFSYFFVLIAVCCNVLGLTNGTNSLVLFEELGAPDIASVKIVIVSP